MPSDRGPVSLRVVSLGVGGSFSPRALGSYGSVPRGDDLTPPHVAAVALRSIGDSPRLATPPSKEALGSHTGIAVPQSGQAVTLRTLRQQLGGMQANEIMPRPWLPSALL